MSGFLRAKTGLEFAVYLLFSMSFVHGLVAGEVLFVGRTGFFMATIGNDPLWYWSIMTLSLLCVGGLLVTTRIWWRNRKRWFPE